LEVTVKTFSKGYNEATSLVLYYVDDEYRKTHPDLLTMIGNKPDVWLKAIAIARENGLLYYFSKRVIEEGKFSNEPFKKIVEQEEKNLIKLKKTLHFINSLFEREGLDFMFIKLYRGIPYAPRDVDILVRKEQSHQIFAALKRRNITLKRFNGVETQFKEEGLLKVDLYQGFYYLSLDFLDGEFLWKDSRTVNVSGVDCLIPSYEADFLSLIIHAILGHRYLSLLDFLYAKSLLNRKLNLDESLRQAKKYGWSSAFLTMVSTIQNIHQELYLGANTTKLINFPYTFSPRFILKAFQGFSNMPISAKTKFTFILSTMIDSVFHEYQMIQRSTSFEAPDEVKNAVMRIIHKVRGLSGDYKYVDEEQSV